MGQTQDFSGSASHCVWAPWLGKEPGINPSNPSCLDISACKDSFISEVIFFREEKKEKKKKKKEHDFGTEDMNKQLGQPSRIHI